jgi:hypothetical protein
MEPKFEQFKNMQKDLEEIPKVKSETHFDLNDISKKILYGEEILDTDISLQELIYSELQELEPGLVSILDDYRSRGVIGKEEFLITINYFLIAKQRGPQSDELVEMFKDKKRSIEDCARLLHTISIPAYTRTVLLDVYTKMTEE